MTEDGTQAATDEPFLEKLLSHRLRGYDNHEQSRAALERMSKARAAYYEIDTRVSRDGGIFIRHNPTFVDGAGTVHTINKLTSAEIAQFDGTDRELPTLDVALACFKRQATARQRLCIDIKDAGFERAHLAAVRAHGLEEQVVFLARAPQVLLALEAEGARSAMVLSCLLLTALGPAGKRIAGFLSGRVLKHRQTVVIGEGRFDAPLGDLAIGYQHTLIAGALPPRLADLLARSGGGVAVSRFLVGRRLTDACHKAGLKVWAYAAHTPGDFETLAAMPGVDVVFSEDAPAVLAGPIVQL
ncbi:MAG: hypothetical protein R3D67_13590 [Hyphomicrobiaceae bacterium]